MIGKAIEAIKLVKKYRVREGGLLRGRYNIVEALRGVSFSVPWNSVFGLLGPNGAGKTTIVKILATLLEPDSGDAFIAGYSSVREPIEVRKRIGVMLSVEKGFFWKLTAEENLKYFGMLYGLRGRALKDRVDYVLKVTGLEELGARRKRFEDMSLGMKARLGLARALLRDSPVLILDEPTLGLDPASARHIRSLLKKLAASGKAVLITTHNMFEAEILCDKVAIINKGVIIAEGSPGELKNRVRKTAPLVMVLRGETSLARDIASWIKKETGYPAKIDHREGEIIVRVLAELGSEEVVFSKTANYVLNKGLKIVEARVESPSLEDVFVKLTSGG